jgi:hypothetical protein
MLYVDPLLSNDRKISSCAKAVTRQRPASIVLVFSVTFLPPFYKHGKFVESDAVSVLVGEQLILHCCEQLIAEAGGYFWNTEDGSRFQATTVKI